MNFKKIMCTIVPAVIMWIFIASVYSNIFDIRELDLKGLFLASLILIFPIVYLAQGVLGVIVKNNPIIDYVVSSAGFLLVASKYMNSSAYGYVVYFGVFYLIGYVVAKRVSKRKKVVPNGC